MPGESKSDNVNARRETQRRVLTLFYTKVGKTVKQLTSMAKLTLPVVALGFFCLEHLNAGGIANPQVPQAPS